MNASPTAGVTILPPVDGAAPHPPVAMQSTFEALTEALAEPLALHERLGRGVGQLGRVARATLSQMPYRQRADGLSPAATERWAKQVTSRLSPLERSALLAYARDCRAWERRLRRRIGSDRADPDWDMTSAPNVAPSAPEAMFAHALEDAGIPVWAQVGVAKEKGGRRRGGWYGSFWLDCAHRDIGYLLRIDLELDGHHHQLAERKVRDAERNAILAQRGWYVVRLSASALGGEGQRRMVGEVVALAARHRHAIVVARSHLPALERAVAPEYQRGQHG